MWLRIAPLCQALEDLVCVPCQVEVIKSVSAHSGRVNCLLYFREEQGALWGSTPGAQGQGNRAAMALNRTKGFLFSGASDRCVKVWNIWDVGRRVSPATYLAKKKRLPV